MGIKERAGLVIMGLALGLSISALLAEPVHPAIRIATIIVGAVLWFTRDE